jgi:hypothetical protein
VGAAATVALAGGSESGLTSLADVFADPKAYDGRTLTISGEAIGEIVRAQGELWVQLNDDAYARRSIAEGGKAQGQNVSISVVLPARDASRIEHFGDYGTKGDIIEVTGRFNAVCDRHGGETDFHATSVRVVSRGYRISHPLDVPLAVASILAVLLTATLAAVRRHVMSRPGFKRKGW